MAEAPAAHVSSVTIGSHDRIALSKDSQVRIPSETKDPISQAYKCPREGEQKEQRAKIFPCLARKPFALVITPKRQPEQIAANKQCGAKSDQAGSAHQRFNRIGLSQKPEHERALDNNNRIGLL